MISSSGERSDFADGSSGCVREGFGAEDADRAFSRSTALKNVIDSSSVIAAVVQEKEVPKWRLRLRILG